jgi:sodium/potassium/calcium exchanger 6
MNTALPPPRYRLPLVVCVCALLGLAAVYQLRAWLALLYINTQFVTSRAKIVMGDYSCEVNRLPLHALATKDYCAFIDRYCNRTYFAVARFYYCSRPTVGTLVLLMIALIFISILLFVSLSVLVANYLYPILRAACHQYHINDKLFSFVVVPFVNCFPDLVNYYTSLKTDSIDLTLGQVIGSILIVFTLVTGSICILQPFDVAVNRDLLMNDFVLVFLVVLVFLYFILDGKITIFECACMILLYFLYAAYLLLQKHPQNEQEDPGALSAGEPDLESGGAFVAFPLYSPTHLLLSVPVAPSFGIEDALSVISDEMEADSAHKTYGAVHDADAVDLRSFGTTPTKASNAIATREAASAVSLCSSVRNEGKLHSWRPVLFGLLRTFQVLFNLIDLTLFVLIPYSEDDVRLALADLGELARQDEVHSVWLNWRKCAHLDAVTVLVSYLRCLAIPGVLYMLYGEGPSPYWGAIVVFLAVWTRLLFVTNRTPAFAVRIVSLMATLLIVSEILVTILQILKNLGVIMRISESLLGLTIFAVTNSVNDIITNVTLANLGQPILGINACLGTPLLLILLGVGFNGLFLTLRRGTKLVLDVNTHLMVTTLGLLVVLAFYIVYIPANGWRLDRRLGVIVVLWWVFITVINCLV